jgi:imidazoleglycerol-phosphate dehydratase/histidinol-phosphatase
MKKILFIDRDGTIIKEPQDYQIDHISKFDFLPDVLSSLGIINYVLDYKLVMVTNQDGLGTKNYPETDFWPYQELMLRILKSEGIEFSEIHIDRSFPQDNSKFRKPNIGMVEKYLAGKYDIENSYVIGDRWSDIQLAHNIGAKSIMIGGESVIDKKPENIEATLVLNNWKQIKEHLIIQDRKAKYVRNTSETSISADINLDGSGIANIDTGLAFFDHMLEQIARHGHIDMNIKTIGDLEIDEHHTIEDTAITLGALFQEALAKKAGIERYGFALPMDDVIAQVMIDFGGRPWIEWDVNFTREKIGDVPTEMFYHFFKSFSDHAKCNLNIKGKGKNEHHLIEGIFKAFAKAIKMAKERKLNDYSIPSTKGIL